MFNPDYPSSTGANFLNYTYQQNQNPSYYYPGNNGYNNPPYGYGYDNNYQPDSRRNMMNPVNPFSQFGQTQPTSIPENAVQPFSSYPASTPQQAQQQQMGLNAMIEGSRRNLTSVNVNPADNPWAQNQQIPVNNNPFYPQAPVNTFNMNGCYDPYNPLFNSIEPSMMALYGGFGTPSTFDKSNVWDNYYTQTRPLNLPNIDWTAMQNQQQYQYNQPMYNQPQYPVQQYPTAQQSWKEIAERNWANL